jgi:hypothetical protein
LVGGTDTCRMGDLTGLAIARLRLTLRRRPYASSWTWPGRTRLERRLQVPQALLTAIEIVSVVCAFVTVIFVVVVRYFWRRGKKLREP